MLSDMSKIKKYKDIGFLILLIGVFSSIAGYLSIYTFGEAKNEISTDAAYNIPGLAIYDGTNPNNKADDSFPTPKLDNPQPIRIGNPFQIGDPIQVEEPIVVLTAFQNENNQVYVLGSYNLEDLPGKVNDRSVTFVGQVDEQDVELEEEEFNNVQGETGNLDITLDSISNNSQFQFITDDGDATEQTGIAVTFTISDLGEPQDFGEIYYYETSLDSKFSKLNLNVQFSAPKNLIDGEQEDNNPGLSLVASSNSNQNVNVEGFYNPGELLGETYSRYTYFNGSITKENPTSEELAASSNFSYAGDLGEDAQGNPIDFEGVRIELPELTKETVFTLWSFDQSMVTSFKINDLENKGEQGQGTNVILYEGNVENTNGESDLFVSILVPEELF